MITIEDVRAYFRSLNSASCHTYKNNLSALKVFLRDFLGKPQLVESFKFPRPPFKPKHIVTKEELQTFFKYLEQPKEKALFLLYATSGLRRKEVIYLKPENVEFKSRMITPCVHKGDSKKSWVSFFNAEAETALNERARREWSCCEMALMGVNDRYIDAFCGRTPKTILARNYTDYSPERLKQIYEKADIKVIA